MIVPCSGRSVKSSPEALPVKLKSFEAVAGTVKLTTTGPAVPVAPTWMCAAVMPLGKLNTSTVQVTVRVAMLTTTVALPKAPVLRPGAGVSSAPVSVAVRVKVWAEAGAAVNPIVTIAASSGIVQRVFMGILRYGFRQ